MIRGLARWFLGTAYLAAGALHLAKPAPFVKIVPEWVPSPETVVALTGIAELLGAAALLQIWSKDLRQAAAWGLALYALCVWPANFHHMVLDMARADHGLGLGYHVPRLLAQPLIVWLALWAGEATDWPLARRARSPAG
ncbi:membrane protein [Tsuneonella deserti]|uniref:Membrane protein n=1 Tax=Tsuneonella deserti TaxID=2035528 RepID=A0ABQ1S7P7_9SPHN|nr:membrane protein [Tsuneonella deserti]